MQITRKIKKGINNPNEIPQYLRQKFEYYKLKLKYEEESVEFYKELQDSKVEHGIAYSRDLGIGEAQFEFAKSQGLLPDDKMLDIGCGDLRGGRYAIDYLQSERYAGIDISEQAIEDARKNVSKWGLESKEPILLTNYNLKFTEFEENEFDFVLANSVWTHLPKSEIRECLEHIGRVLHPDGIFCPSFNKATDRPEKSLTNSVRRSHLYRYPYDFLKELGEEYGYNVSYDSYDEHPNDEMGMLIIEHAE